MAFRRFMFAATVGLVVVLQAAPTFGGGPPKCFGMPATIVGHPDGDDIEGTDGNDVIVGSGEIDRINARGGVDRICAGNGHDILKLAVLLGNDLVDMGGGSDEIQVRIEGAPSGQTVAGTLVPATFRGGPGFDEVIFETTGRFYRMTDEPPGAADLEVFRGPGRVMEADLSSIDTFRGSDGDDIIHEEGHPEVVTLDGRSGNDAINGSREHDVIYDGDGDDRVQAGSGEDTVRPGGGKDVYSGAADNDTLDFSADEGAGVFVDLESQDANANGSKGVLAFENIIGSPKGDTLRGDPQANAIDGGRGNDAIRPGRGNDVVKGGAGRDRVEYSDAATPGTELGEPGEAEGVEIDLLLGKATGEPAGKDALESIEDVYGSDGDDMIIGSDSANRLDGADGDDVVDGRAGTDVLFGGPGNDTVGDPDGASLADGGPGDDEVFVPINIEDGRVVGGPGADRVLGDGILSGGEGNDFLAESHGVNVASQTLLGGPGKDLLRPSGGDDTVDGGPGEDTVEYTDVGTVSVTIDLNSGTSLSTEVGVDSLANIENASWTFNGADTIIGTSARNKLFGGNNNDRLSGGGGNDLLQGGDNDDELDGGDGKDSLDGGNGFDVCDGEGRTRCEA